MKTKKLVLKDSKGLLYTTSCMISDFLNMDHGSVLRIINSLDCCETFWQHNFRENLYSDTNGATQQCIDISRFGFQRIAKDLKNERNDEQIALILCGFQL